ncbi:MAG: hypothetical protein ACXVIM_06045 [Acidimicrobiia bacterium]
MQPFERLRYLARWSEDDGPELLSEAADCLAAFGGDPAGLVVACRRLLAHHPSSATLWGVCAQVLGAPDAVDASWTAWQAFTDDATPGRLVSALPFPHDDPIAVLGWPDVVASGLDERPDLDVVAVRIRGQGDQLSRRLRRAEQPVRVVEESELLALEPSHLLIETSAAGGGQALVPLGAIDLAAAGRSHGTKVWLVAGMGRVLPERLFQSLTRAVGDDPATELIGAEQVDHVVGPTGIDPPAAFVRRADCAVAPELLRLAG